MYSSVEYFLFGGPGRPPAMHLFSRYRTDNLAGAPGATILDVIESHTPRIYS